MLTKTQKILGIITLALICIVGIFFLVYSKVNKTNQDNPSTSNNQIQASDNFIDRYKPKNSSSVTNETPESAETDAQKKEATTTNRSANETEKTSTPKPQTPTCDQAKKATYTQGYNKEMSAALTKRNEAKDTAYSTYDQELVEIPTRYSDIFDPYTRDSLIAQAKSLAYSTLQQNLNLADADFSATSLGLNAILDANLKNINCSST